MLLRLLRLESSLSLKMSAIAVRWMSLPALSALAAASVPRPPHPTSPIRIVSLPAAWTEDVNGNVALAAAPANAAEDFRKARRVTALFGSIRSAPEEHRLSFRGIAPVPIRWGGKARRCDDGSGKARADRSLHNVGVWSSLCAQQSHIPDRADRIHT